MSTNLLKQKFTTPMMQQYVQVKSKYNDCLLFFRLGDFYELFLDDAIIGSKVLDITLTSRDRGSDGRIPMAGVPYHAVDSYLSKLVKSGFKVAICEQLSDPSKPGLVQRDVVRIVTPGTILDEKTLEKRENNYIISIFKIENAIGFAATDLSTGHFTVSKLNENELLNEIFKLKPAECILDPEHYNNPEILNTLNKYKNLNIYCFHKASDLVENAEQTLLNHFNLKTLQSFGVENNEIYTKPAAILLSYLRHTQKNSLLHINKIQIHQNQKYLSLDEATITNLEIFSTIRDSEKKGSLIYFLDNTNTAMGARLLRTWVLKPLIKHKNILNRQNAVDFFVKNEDHASILQQKLKELSDIERILSRIAVGLGNPKDLISLKQNLIRCLDIRNYLNRNWKSEIGIKQITNYPPATSVALRAGKLPITYLSKITEEINNNLKESIEVIEQTIVDDPPFDPRQGGIVKLGVNEKLDELKNKIKDSQEYILNLESIERKRTGINSLKVKFNKIFGYYIEVSKANAKLIPSDYFRKQTLVNAERYETPELKKHEQIILKAEETINEIEYEIFLETIQKILNQAKVIQNCAHAIAKLDCILNFANLAVTNNFCKPTITKDNTIKIEDGRHPVVESLLNKPFVPNSVELDTKTNQLHIITGPNMAGKSVYIRQVALITLLAQIGSFVPAKSATIGIVDKLFVRSGASDVITSGLSTFMVEMVEVANILNNVTNKSLIIMDEVGRGTSTYDGISIAQAIAEFLVNNKNVKPKTLFATHYHELQKLEQKYPDKIKNFHMAVEKNKDEPIFLHKIIRGGAEASYGIAVAKLAGVLKEVTDNAEKILKSLEATSNANTKTDTKDTEINEEIKRLNVDKITPLEALNILANIKMKYDSKKTKY